MNILTRLRKTFGYALGCILPLQGMIWFRNYMEKNIIDQTDLFLVKNIYTLILNSFYGCG